MIGAKGEATQLSNSNSTGQGSRLFVSSHTGLWKTCRTVRANNTDESKLYQYLSLISLRFCDTI